MKYEIVSIEPAIEAFRKMLTPLFGNRAEDVTEENIQSRARGVALMAVSPFASPVDRAGRIALWIFSICVLLFLSMLPLHGDDPLGPRGHMTSDELAPRNRCICARTASRACASPSGALRRKTRHCQSSSSGLRREEVR